MTLVKDRHVAVLALTLVDTLALVLWLWWFWFLGAGPTPTAFDVDGSLYWVPPVALVALGSLGFLVLARMPREQRLQSRSAMVLAWASIFVLLPVGFYLWLVMMSVIVSLGGGFDA